MHFIKQKRFFSKKEYTILEHKLHFKTSYIGGENEGIIAFEDISKEKSTNKETNPILLIISIFLYLLAGASFVWRNDKDVDKEMWIVFTLMATSLLIVYILMRENSWKIKTYNKGFLYLFKHNPNEKEVNAFIDTLFLERDNYLKQTYLNLDANLSYETQVNDLKWLRNVEAISREEFNKYYDDLKLLFAPKKGNIGFER